VTDGVRVRPGAEAFSLGDGPVGVLLVHGFTGSPASTRPLGEWLASHGVAVEGVRLPGHGTDVGDLRRRRAVEWIDEASRGLDAIGSRCRSVVAFGLSMGASVVLAPAAARPSDIDGIALANPYVFDRRHALIPIGRRILRDVPGRPNDIAKPQMDEMAYDRMPVPAIVEMAAMMRRVRSVLPSIRQPIVVFASATDHVISRSNPRKILARIGSERTEVVPCRRSRHVVTLDHDAPLVRERVLSFALELDEAKLAAT
jgi:carboxylesterase